MSDAAEIERLKQALDKPLRETILAVLNTMPACAAPEHLAAQIERQVQGWQRIGIEAVEQPTIDLETREQRVRRRYRDGS